MKCTPIRLAVAALLAWSSAPALAARPLQTDDAGVIARGSCELEGSATKLSAADGRTTETGLQAGCGVGWDSQLAAAIGSSRSLGVRDSSLSVSGKTALWALDGGRFEGAALALGWMLRTAKEQGNSWRHADTSVKLLASLPLTADYTAHANLGHARDEIGKQRSTPWGVALEHAGLGAERRWAPMAEWYGDDRERPWWNVGLRYTAAPDRAFIDISFGRQLSADRPSLLNIGFRASF